MSVIRIRVKVETVFVKYLTKGEHVVVACRFCAMACLETRLNGFIELMIGHVLMELRGNCSFLNFV